jgi:tetratricopeptide (TPR) repeat protein
MIGLSRGWSGDLRGREDVRRSIEITEEIGSHLSAHCYGMLADMECQIGNLAAAFELQGHARQHAERFGHAGFVRWLAAERVGEDYWTGRWDEAVSAADAVIAEAEAGVPNFMEGYCRATRGHIRLARNDVPGALADAEQALEFARVAEDLQMLYPALAFSARAETTVGSLQRGADLSDELLALWRSRVDSYPASAWAVDLACALEPLDRGAALVDAARRVRAPTRWLEAAVALLTGEYRAASEGFSGIGSLPDEAFARLRGGQALFRSGRTAEAQTELKPAVDFYRRVGADAYLGEAEALAGSSFVA